MSLAISWGDGRPLDSRLTNLLAKYSLPATFYTFQEYYEID